MNSFSLPLALGLPGGMEWVLILVVILVLFGGKKIPELMRGVGKGVGELQKGLDEGKKGFSNMMHNEDEDEKPNTTATSVNGPVTTSVPNNNVQPNPPTA